jgi:hypothetical protein
MAQGSKRQEMNYRYHGWRLPENLGLGTFKSAVLLRFTRGAVEQIYIEAACSRE